MEPAFTQIAVKILFDDSSGFDEIRFYNYFAREADIMGIVYGLDKD